MGAGKGVGGGYSWGWGKGVGNNPPARNNLAVKIRQGEFFAL